MAFLKGVVHAGGTLAGAVASPFDNGKLLKEQAKRTRDNFAVVSRDVEGAFSANGVATRVAEHIPLVNAAIVQPLHKKAKQHDALARAQAHDPIGRNGIITRMGEQIPIVSDGIRGLHLLAGNDEQAARAQARTLEQLLSKDGALTKLAEALPGTNLVAALVQDLNGNKEEAKRALNLLKTWDGATHRDGFLTKLAECFPGSGTVAFGLHLRAGNYAHALRAFTGGQRVAKVIVRDSYVSIGCKSLGEFSMLDLFVTGALEPGSVPHMRIAEILGDAFHLRSTQKTQMLKQARDNVNQQISEQRTAQLEQLPRMLAEQLRSAEQSLPECTAWVVQKVRAAIRHAKLQEWVVAFVRECLDLKFPPIDADGMDFLKVAVLTTPITVSSSVPHLQEVESHAPSQDLGFVEKAAGVACCSCFGFTAGLPMGGLACFAGLLAACGYAAGVAAKAGRSTLNSANRESYGNAGLEASALASARAAIKVEVKGSQLKTLQAQVRDYLLTKAVVNERSAVHRHFDWFLWAAGRGLCALAGVEVDAARAKLVPLVFALEVPPQPLCTKADHGLELCLTSFKASVFANLDLSGKLPRLLSASLYITHDTIRDLVEDCCQQIRDQDLRYLHKGLKDFVREIRIQLQAGVVFGAGDVLKLVIPTALTELHLPP